MFIGKMCLETRTSWRVNPLKPNDIYIYIYIYIYIGRTAPLTSRRYILCIYSTNIHTEYFKLAAQSPFFFLQNAVYFTMLLCLVPVLFVFYIQGVLKFKCKIPAPKYHESWSYIKLGKFVWMSNCHLLWWKSAWSCLFVCWSVCLSVSRPVCRPVGQSVYTLFAAVSLLSLTKVSICKFRNRQNAADSDDPIKVL